MSENIRNDKLQQNPKIENHLETLLIFQNSIIVHTKKWNNIGCLQTFTSPLTLNITSSLWKGFGMLCEGYAVLQCVH